LSDDFDLGSDSKGAGGAVEFKA